MLIALKLNGGKAVLRCDEENFQERNKILIRSKIRISF